MRPVPRNTATIDIRQACKLLFFRIDYQLLIRIHKERKADSRVIFAVKTDQMGVDELLLQLVARGDEASLERLYERHGRVIYSLSLHIVGNIPDAEEVTQEIFLKLWMKAGSFVVSKGSAFAWLMSIARRHAIDRTRSKRYKAQKRELAFETLEWTDSFSDGVEDDGKTSYPE